MVKHCFPSGSKDVRAPRFSTQICTCRQSWRWEGQIIRWGAYAHARRECKNDEWLTMRWTRQFSSQRLQFGTNESHHRSGSSRVTFDCTPWTETNERDREWERALTCTKVCVCECSREQIWLGRGAIWILQLGKPNRNRWWNYSNWPIISPETFDLQHVSPFISHFQFTLFKCAPILSLMHI